MWYVTLDGGEINAACGVICATDTPFLYAVCSEGDTAMRRLLKEVLPELPDRIIADVGLGLLDVFCGPFRATPCGEFLKMRLVDVRAVPAPSQQVERLGPSDLDELTAFYQGDAYTKDEVEGRCFAPYMLEWGPYCGIRREHRLVAAGGVHVCSRRFGVAALANIATRPDSRRQGLATTITCAICRALPREAIVVGLNVHAENHAAIRCYENVGFGEVRRFLSVLLQSVPSRRA